MPAVHPEHMHPQKTSEAPSLEEGMLLRIQAPNHPPQQVLIRSRRCSVGADRDCTLRLVAEGVQPVHCVIERWQTQANIQRLAPQTWLNNQEFHSAPFRPGDRLRVGPIEIYLVSLGGDPSKVSAAQVSPPISAASKSGLAASESVPESSERKTIPPREPPFPSAGLSVSSSDEKARPASPVESSEALGEQTARHLGHQRAKRLVGLLRQSRQEIDQLQAQIEQLQKDFETLRSREADLRIQVEQNSAWKQQTQQWTEIEARLNRRQQDLDRREAQLESQRQALEYQWAQWKAEQTQLQQELQHRADLLRQQQTELLQAQKSLQTQLQEFHAQQQALPRQQQVLQEQEQTLRQQQQSLQQREETLQRREQLLEQQQQALAQKEQELADWQQRLEALQQALAEQEATLAEREAALAEQQKEFQNQQALLESRRPQAQREPSQEEFPSEEAVVSQERIERYTRSPEPRSGSHAEEILRRLGMMPHFEEEEESATGGASSHESPPETKSSSSEIGSSSRSRQKTSDDSQSEEEDALIHSYMERLLGRGWKQATQASSSEEEAGAEGASSAGRSSRYGRGEPTPEASPVRPGHPRRQPTAEWVPRAVAPEREVDLEAMRTLANLTASSAIERHHRRKAMAAVWAKFLVSVFSLALGCGMLWVWGGKREHDVALYAAAACFAVAALWGVQYLVLAVKLVVRSFGGTSAKQRPLPPGTNLGFPPPDSMPSEEGSSRAAAETTDPSPVPQEKPENSLAPGESGSVSAAENEEQKSPIPEESLPRSPEGETPSESGDGNPSTS